MSNAFDEVRAAVDQAKFQLAAASLPRHKFWGAGEPDCPPELKAPNGELHTMRCKVCGDGWRKSRDVCFGAVAVGPCDERSRLSGAPAVAAAEPLTEEQTEPPPDGAFPVYASPTIPQAGLIEAADKHADDYEGQDIPARDVRAAITNAFYAGARFRSLPQEEAAAQMQKGPNE